MEAIKAVFLALGDCPLIVQGIFAAGLLLAFIWCAALAKWVIAWIGALVQYVRDVIEYQEWEERELERSVSWAKEPQTQPRTLPQNFSISNNDIDLLIAEWRDTNFRN